MVNPPEELTNTLGEYLSKNGKTQLRIAETQKYAHVTFFFNGGVEKPNEGEDRALIPSSKVATFDLKPEMSAYRGDGKGRRVHQREEVRRDDPELRQLRYGGSYRRDEGRRKGRGDRGYLRGQGGQRHSGQWADAPS